MSLRQATCPKCEAPYVINANSHDFDHHRRHWTKILVYDGIETFFVPDNHTKIRAFMRSKGIPIFASGASTVTRQDMHQVFHRHIVDGTWTNHDVGVKVPASILRANLADIRTNCLICGDGILYTDTEAEARKQGLKRGTIEHNHDDGDIRGDGFYCNDCNTNWGLYLKLKKDPNWNIEEPKVQSKHHRPTKKMKPSTIARILKWGDDRAPLLAKLEADRRCSYSSKDLFVAAYRRRHKL